MKMFFCSLTLLLLVGCNPEKQILMDLTISISTADNSMTSLDWVGTYNGTLPSAGYGGIGTTLILNEDFTYKLLTTYLGKGDKTFESNGNFVWDSEKSIITLLDESGGWNQQYKVEKNRLFHLDEDGNKITGDLAPMYILSKIITDWVGTYTGALPCADCKGIGTALTLHKDLTYKLFTTYLGKDDKTFESNGNFVWDSEKSIITLLDESGGWNQRYKVEENRLFHLDKDGNKITGWGASKYILSKIIIDIPKIVIPKIVIDSNIYKLMIGITD